MKMRYVFLHEYLHLPLHHQPRVLRRFRLGVCGNLLNEVEDARRWSGFLIIVTREREGSIRPCWAELRPGLLAALGWFPRLVQIAYMKIDKIAKGQETSMLISAGP